MEVIIENIITYSAAALLVSLVLYFYFRRGRKISSGTSEKIDKARAFGFHEPVSLHPVVNHDICIGSGACVKACPEKDILGIVNGQAHTINASRCVGHGACFHACPVEAISLCIGTEKRGVELPHISQNFETNVKGIYIAGELGGMGLIKNAVEQGKQAVQNICAAIDKSVKAEYDIVIIGAGPAGISATLEAAGKKLRYLTLEQDSLGGTVFSFPRSKIVMTSPMDLPLHGKVKLSETTKMELLELWNKVIETHNININELEGVDSIEKHSDTFLIKTNKNHYTSRSVLLATGRRGTPRKLGIPGENLEKVYYRLLEPELIHNLDILVVGGGDSAVEAALMLSDENNKVTLSYRGSSFSRLKPRNLEKISRAAEGGKVSILFSSNISEITGKAVKVITENGETLQIPNDLVYIFAGGELPFKFLEKAGVKITRKFGQAVMKGR